MGKIWAETCNKNTKMFTKSKSWLRLIHVHAILASMRHHFSWEVLEYNSSSFKTNQLFSESCLGHEMSPHLTIKSIMLGKPMASAWHCETL